MSPPNHTQLSNNRHPNPHEGASLMNTMTRRLSLLKELQSVLKLCYLLGWGLDLRSLDVNIKRSRGIVRLFQVLFA